MTYALEADEREFERLERQSSHSSYDYRVELSGFHAEPGAKILDAGCGSGIVSRYLAERFPESQIVGGDFAGNRLEFARRRAQNLKNVEFREENLLHLSFASGTFDGVVCRFVLQHLSEESRLSAITEMARVLRPGGKLYIIDTDGFMVNLFPTPPKVAAALTKLASLPSMDFHVGRKIPSLFKRAGLGAILTRGETVLVSPETLESEIEMMRERFENARPFLKTLVEGNLTVEEFTEQYLSAMAAPEAVSFYTKFIVQGTKTTPKLTLIEG